MVTEILVPVGVLPVLYILLSVTGVIFDTHGNAGANLFLYCWLPPFLLGTTLSACSMLEGIRRHHWATFRRAILGFLSCAAFAIVMMCLYIVFHKHPDDEEGSSSAGSLTSSADGGDDSGGGTNAFATLESLLGRSDEDESYEGTLGWGIGGGLNGSGSGSYSGE